MSVTSGFFNSLNHDRLYDATQMSQIFDGIIRDGVYESIGTCFAVNADGSLYVTVGVGRAWFDHTWIYNDAILPLALTEEYAPEVLTNRYDAIVLDIDSSPDVRADSIKIVKGTPSSEIDFRNYVAGTVPDSITLINEENHHQYPIAIIERPASQTTILGSEIHNMVGTNYCPFVTGILQVLSADTFFKEWAAELDEFVAKETGDFSKWSKDQRAEFLAWAAASRTDFEQWEIDSKADFDAWYANIKIQLSGNVATNLQRQISDLQAEKLDVSRYESEIGNTDISQLGDTITEAIMNSGGSRLQVSIIRDPDADIDTIVCTASQGDYVLTASMDTINTIEFSGFRELTPITVTINYNFEGEAVEMTDSVSVECYKKYSLTFKLKSSSPIITGFDVIQWQTLGRVDNQKETLEEIVADENIIRQLFLVHDAVDYLVENIEDSAESLDIILNNKYCQKWINLSNYALDALQSNETIKALMDEIGLYGYGELDYMPKVPTMTSNTAPFGECGGKNKRTDGSYDYFYAFANNKAHGYESTVNNGFIYYKFTKPICIKGFNFGVSGSRTQTINFVASNTGADGSWVTLKTLANISGLENKAYADNDTEYLYYGFEIVSNAYGATAQLLQFYAWEPKGLVPIMTSNNAPYGNITYSSENTQYSGNAFHVFDGDDSTYWAGTSSTNQHVTYHFAQPVNIKRVAFLSTPNRCKDYEIYVSNDGTFTDYPTPLYTGTKASSATEVMDYIDISDDGYYSYCRFFVKNTYGNDNPIIKTLQFYGRSLSVSVPKMTSNTEPWGEASCSSYATSREAYKAFDDSYTASGSSASGWQPLSTDSIGSAYVQYDFKTPKKVKMLGITTSKGGSACTFTFQLKGSNDGSSFEVIKSDIQSVQGSGWQYYSVDTTKEYRIYRMVITASSTGSLSSGWGSDIQFYGLDYSEKEFAEDSKVKYIYDHGVEVEDIIIPTINSTYGSANKYNDYLEITTTSSILPSTASNEYFPQIAFDNISDFANYKIVRIVLGKELKTSSSRWGILMFPNAIPRKRGDSTISSKEITNINDNYIEIPLNYSNEGFIIMSSGDSTKITIEEVWIEKGV